MFKDTFSSDTPPCLYACLLPVSLAEAACCTLPRQVVEVLLEAGTLPLQVVEVLLEAGADVHAEVDEALLWAAENGRSGVVEVLIGAGADVHARVRF